MQSGSHIKVWRGCYYHHGIYVGGNQVVHYKSYGIVMTDLEDFCRESSPEIVHHPNQDYDLTVQRPMNGWARTSTASHSTTAKHSPTGA